jgi:CRP-like cAMP-binding protein
MATPTRNGEDGPGNNLLRALRPADLALLEPHLRPWSGKAGEVLYEPGDDVKSVFFPCGPSMVSYRVVLHDGPDIETVLVGREGAVGGIVSNGRLPAYARAIVQFPGTFLRLELRLLDQAKLHSPTLRQLFSRYADCLMAQIFQSVACNAVHSIEARAVKWLLAAADRTGEQDVPLTQDQLASMLGVGRSYVSRVVQSLKAQHVLETRRGGMRIRDLPRMKLLSCQCNEAVQRHFEVVLEGVYPGEEEGAATEQAGDSRSQPMR